MNCILCNKILQASKINAECVTEVVAINGYKYSHLYIYEYDTNPLFHIIKEKYLLAFDSKINELEISSIPVTGEMQDILKINIDNSDFISLIKSEDLILENKIKLYQTFS